MLTGFYVMKGGGVSQYSLPFDRGSVSGYFAVEAQALVGTPTDVVVTVEQKNRDEATWGTPTTLGTFTAVGVQSVTIANLKEQVRFKFVVTASNDWEGFKVYIAPPVWRPD